MTGRSWSLVRNRHEFNFKLYTKEEIEDAEGRKFVPTRLRVVFFAGKLKIVTAFVQSKNGGESNRAYCESGTLANDTPDFIRAAVGKAFSARKEEYGNS